MKRAQATLYIDKYRPIKSGKCAIKIKVTFNRKRKYYSTGLYLTVKEYNKVMFGLRKTEEEKHINQELNMLLYKSQSIVRNLNFFNFEMFESQFFDKRSATESVSFSFDNYICELEKEKRVSTASSYKSAINSLEKFKPNLTFIDITPKFLKEYEEWMLDNGKSITTVGFYLRNLRTIINIKQLPIELYPFGSAKNKYTIKTGRNIKKALKVEDIKKIYQYKTTKGSYRDRARDFWIFLYLNGGMNVKDFCLLKWKNIGKKHIKYKRAKTQRTSGIAKHIIINLMSQSELIIKKWAVPSDNKEAYVFPILEPGMSAFEERKRVQNLTRQINNHMKKIVSEIGIKENVTTYFARHSFATILKRSGVDVGVISELLGHSSIVPTESYLDRFEIETIQQATSALTVGFDL